MWHVHYANANSRLDGLIAPIGAAIASARERAERVIRPVALDLVVRALPGWGIPEMGMVGYCPSGEIIELTFDPQNPNLEAHLGEAIERQVVHELHHALRWRGPSYGRTLGEALVSEGLAGQFVRQLYDSPPEPWERALPADQLAEHAAFFETHWETGRYDHRRVFFGAGDLPRWLGYTFAYRLVGEALPRLGRTAADLVDAPAGVFRPFLPHVGA